MTVAELIAELKKLPKDLEVYSAAHDHGKFETDSLLNQCVLIDKNEMTKIENDKNGGLCDSFTSTPTKYVVIRPL